MKKLIFVIFIILGIATLYVVLKDFNPNNSINTNKIPNKDYQYISGVVIKINEYDKQQILEKYKTKGVNNLSNLVVASYSQQSDPSYFLLYDISGVEKELLTINPESIVGKCINLSATPDISKSNVNDFYSSLRLLSIRKYEITDDLDCYLNRVQTNTMYTEYNNLKKIASTIQHSTRPAFDIAYDYQITLNAKDAEELGYMNSSGLTQNDENITINVVAKNLAILQSFEKAVRENKTLILEGVFEWQYAETMVFNVVSTME